MIGGLPDSEGRGEVISENSGIGLLSIDEILIKAGVQTSVGPLSPSKAFCFKGNLSSLEHRVIGSARSGIHETFF